MVKCMHVHGSEPEIAVVHQTNSDHVWQLSDQKSICSDKVLTEICVDVRPKYDHYVLADLDILSEHLNDPILDTDALSMLGYLVT